MITVRVVKPGEPLGDTILELAYSSDRLGKTSNTDVPVLAVDVLNTPSESGDVASPVKGDAVDSESALG